MLTNWLLMGVFAEMSAIFMSDGTNFSGYFHFVAVYVDVGLVKLPATATPHHHIVISTDIVMRVRIQ